MRVDLSAIDKRKPGVVVGAGLVALDVVIPADPEESTKVWAGGTCGNVLAALAYLGWASYPVARIGEDPPGKRVIQDLERWGVRVEFVVREEGEGTPVIAEYIRDASAGRTHTFSCRCPNCGSGLPRYRTLRVGDALPLLPRLPRPDVAFFDRVSPGIVRIAQHCVSAGALVVFEPSGVGDARQFQEMVSIAHVVKFSHERMGGVLGSCDWASPAVVIETLGSEGLRYRTRLSWADPDEWHVMPSIPVQHVRDTAGAGDWCTAGILHGLGAGGAKSLLGADMKRLQSAILLGQSLAAWNCTFEGARGGMYRHSRKNLARAIVMALEGRQSGELSLPSANRSADVFACAACPDLPDPSQTQA